MKKEEQKKEETTQETTKDNWVELEPKSDVWQPQEEGDTIEGIYVEVEAGKFGKVYIIQDSEGDLVKLPSHKHLLKRMELAMIGERLQVEYKGERDINKGNPLQLYKVRAQRVQEEAV